MNGCRTNSQLDGYAGLYLEVLRHRRMCLCGMLAAEYQGVPGPGAENPTDMRARSAGIITRQARHRAGLAGLRWRVRYTVGRDTVNSSARSAME